MESIFPRRFRGQWEESAEYYWEGQAERLPFSLPIVHRELAISIFNWDCQRGPQWRRFKGRRFSSLYPLFFFFTETAPFLWLRQIFSQLKCTPKICLKIHWQLVKIIRFWLITTPSSVQLSIIQYFVLYLNGIHLKFFQ